MALSASRVGPKFFRSQQLCGGFRFNTSATTQEEPVPATPGYEPTAASLDETAMRSKQAGRLFDRKSNPNGKIQAFSGAVLAGGGIGLIGFEHSDLFLNLDAAGCGLGVLGGAVLATSGAIPGFLGSDSSAGNPRFEFKLLNDGTLLEADIHSLEEMSQGGPDLLGRLPKEMQQLVSKHAGEESTRTKEWEAKEQGRVTTQIKTDLADGMSIHRLKQKLQPRTFVLDFDVMDTAARRPGGTKTLISQFSESITLMLATASPFDEVVIRLCSPGGSVTDYGLASSQILRLKRAGISTTICVDTVAASGGYMMACIADTLIAAPFAFLGSIGVVAGMPNISKVLKKNDIDYFLFTAGKFKRTVTSLTEATDDDKAKFQAQLEDIHTAFADHVDTNRGNHLAVDQVATGEAWLAVQAMEKGLVDQLMTSDEYLRSRMAHSDVISVKAKKKKKSFMEMLTGATTEMQDGVRGMLGSFGIQQHMNGVQGAKFEDSSGMNAFKH